MGSLVCATSKGPARTRPRRCRIIPWTWTPRASQQCASQLVYCSRHPSTRKQKAVADHCSTSSSDRPLISGSHGQSVKRMICRIRRHDAAHHFFAMGRCQAQRVPWTRAPIRWRIFVAAAASSLESFLARMQCLLASLDSQFPTGLLNWAWALCRSRACRYTSGGRGLSISGSQRKITCIGAANNCLQNLHDGDYTF
jgi:hypothetical protein